MNLFYRAFLAIATINTLVVAFSTTIPTSKPTINGNDPTTTSTTCLGAETRDFSSYSDGHRRELLAISMGVVASIVGNVPKACADGEPTQSTDGEGVVMYKTTSGLKYIELEPGRSLDPSPRYGQICVISYKAYLKLPNAKDKEQFDSSGSYVLKHGSGRMIPGLDEGLHTMKPGGLRRMIIPPKLGFVQSGLGPLPQYPWDRSKLNSLLERMIDQRGGNLVYDVRLEKVMDDEADQGYYDDVELSPEEMEEIQQRLLKGRPTET